MADTLRQQRSNAATELAGLMAEENITDEKFERAESLDSNIAELDEQIKERCEVLKTRADSTLAQPTMSLDRSGATQSRGSNDDQMAAYMRWFNSGGAVHERTISVGSDGALVPLDLQAEMIRELPGSRLQESQRVERSPRMTEPSIPRAFTPTRVARPPNSQMRFCKTQGPMSFLRCCCSRLKAMAFIGKGNSAPHLVAQLLLKA